MHNQTVGSEVGNDEHKLGSCRLTGVHKWLHQKIRTRHLLEARCSLSLKGGQKREQVLGGRNFFVNCETKEYENEDTNPYDQ